MKIKLNIKWHIRLKIAKGHNDELTLVAYKSAKDKAQICAIKPSQCPPGLTPWAIMKKLQVHMTKEVKPTAGEIRNSAAIVQLRQRAHALRAAACFVPGTGTWALECTLCTSRRVSKLKQKTQLQNNFLKNLKDLFLTLNIFNVRELLKYIISWFWF